MAGLDHGASARPAAANDECQTVRDESATERASSLKGCATVKSRSAYADNGCVVTACSDRAFANGSLSLNADRDWHGRGVRASRFQHPATGRSSKTDGLAGLGE
jgi:hypothetical protein